MHQEGGSLCFESKALEFTFPFLILTNRNILWFLFLTQSEKDNQNTIIIVCLFFYLYCIVFVKIFKVIFLTHRFIIFINTPSVYFYKYFKMNHQGMYYLLLISMQQ